MRIDWIDCYKGLLIILVVMGHVFGGAVHLTSGAAQELLHRLYLVIYSFHMPAFFFIAGLMWKDADDGFAAFAIKKVKRLLVPYFVFGLFSMMVWAVAIGPAISDVNANATTDYYSTRLGSSVWTCLLGLLHAGGLSDGNGFRMNSVLWFLPCMFAVLIAFRGLRKLKISGYKWLIVVGLCCALGILAPRYFPHLPWGLSKLPYYLLFVLLGYAMKELVLNSKAKASANPLGWSGLLMVSAVVYAVVVSLLPDPWVANVDAFWWLVYLVVAAVGSMLFAFIAKLLQYRWLSALGVGSLGIMLIHKFPVVFLELKLPLIRQLMNASGCAAVAVALAITAVVVWFCYLVFLLIRRFAPWLLGVKH